MEEYINKLENEISGLKEMKKEKSDEIKKLTRDKKALELAINGDIEKIKLLEEIYGSKAMKDMYCPGKVDLNKFKDNNNIIPIEDWISPEKLDYIYFYIR